MRDRSARDPPPSRSADCCRDEWTRSDSIRPDRLEFQMRVSKTFIGEDTDFFLVGEFLVFDFRKDFSRPVVDVAGVHLDNSSCFDKFFHLHF